MEGPGGGEVQQQVMVAGETKIKERRKKEKKSEWKREESWWYRGGRKEVSVGGPAGLYWTVILGSGRNSCNAWYGVQSSPRQACLHTPPATMRSEILRIPREYQPRCVVVAGHWGRSWPCTVSSTLDVSIATHWANLAIKK